MTVECLKIAFAWWTDLTIAEFNSSDKTSSPKNNTTRYNWNIVESGIKYHKPNSKSNVSVFYSPRKFKLDLHWSLANG
jgi:hypothetical protein